MKFDIKKEWKKYFDKQMEIVNGLNLPEGTVNKNYDSNYDKFVGVNIGSSAYNCIFNVLRHNIKDKEREKLENNLQKFYLICLKHQNELETQTLEDLRSNFINGFYTPIYLTEETKNITIETMSYLKNNYPLLKKEEDEVYMENDEFRYEEGLEAAEAIDQMIIMLFETLKKISNSNEIKILDEILTYFLEIVLEIKGVNVNNRIEVNKEIDLIERIFNHINFIKTEEVYKYCCKNKNNAFNNVRDEKEKLSLEEPKIFFNIVENIIEINIKKIEILFPRELAEFLLGLQWLIENENIYFNKLCLIEGNINPLYKKTKRTYSVEDVDKHILNKVQKYLEEYVVEFYSFSEKRRKPNDTDIVSKIKMKIRSDVLNENIESLGYKKDNKTKKKI